MRGNNHCAKYLHIPYSFLWDKFPGLEMADEQKAQGLLSFLPRAELGLWLKTFVFLIGWAATPASNSEAVSMLRRTPGLSLLASGVRASPEDSPWSA